MNCMKQRLNVLLFSRVVKNVNGNYLKLKRKSLTDWETKWALRLQEFYDPCINTNNEETIMANVVAQTESKTRKPGRFTKF